MIEGISVDALNNIGLVGGCLILVYLFVSDRIVSGKRLRRVEGDLERWQDVALKAMGAADRTVAAAEVVHKLVTSLPDPGLDPAVAAESETP